MRNSHLSLVPLFVLSVPLALGCGSSASGLQSTASAGASALPGGGNGNNAAGATGTPTAGAGNVSGSTGLPGGGAGSVAGAGGASGAAAVAGAGAGGMTATAGAGSAAGGGSTAGAAGMGNAMYQGATGQSAGCGKPPPGIDKIGSFVTHEIHITETLSAQYLPGGKSYASSGNYNFTFRPYTVRLPTGYDPSKKYSVIFGGGGCGGNATDAATNPGAGYDIDKPRESIFVGLPYVAGCFADGGGSTNYMPDTPEVPFVHEVLAEVRANYCVDQSRVFITGHSSGGWESFTVGCALANEIRGISPVSGGLRNHRPACQGPQASIMVEGLGDMANPIGPLVPPSGNLDSGGSAPARDEILKRNGCVSPDFQFTYTTDNTMAAKAGNAPHTAWDPMYPDCVTYTGCPTAFPVVWCALPGGHETDNDGISYIPAMLKFLDSLPSH